MSSAYAIWRCNDNVKLKDTNCTIQGFSQAAVQTSWYIPELNILFDAGIPTDKKPSHVFITHSHTDHTLLAGSIIARTNVGSVYIPEISVEDIKNYTKSLITLGTVHDPKMTMDIYKYEVIGVRPEEIFTIEIKGKKYEVEVFEMDHTVPCVGYGISEIKTKLKQEYHTLSGKEIKELKNQGIVVTEEIKVHQFCYLGDTSIKALENNNIFKYKNIMIECTFLDDKELERADEHCHIHWKYLHPIIEQHKDNYFLLYHFSARYDKEYILNFFKNYNYENMIPLAN